MQLQYIIEDKIGVFLCMIPKCYLEIYGVEIEYALLYANLGYHIKFNNYIPKHIGDNVKISL